ncbi:MAG: hypothetical protein L3J71_03505 [Victivallaceae bacterium]|nr:hypothetical protein [Victivallaceae bacterium]
MVATVSSVSNATPFEIKWRMSFTELSYMIVQSARKAGIKGIHERTKSDELIKRLEFLMDEFSNKKQP